MAGENHGVGRSATSSPAAKEVSSEWVNGEWVYAAVHSPHTTYHSLLTTHPNGEHDETDAVVARAGAGDSRGSGAPRHVPVERDRRHGDPAPDFPRLGSGDGHG